MRAATNIWVMYIDVPECELAYTCKDKCLQLLVRRFGDHAHLLPLISKSPEDSETSGSSCAARRLVVIKPGKLQDCLAVVLVN